LHAILDSSQVRNLISESYLIAGNGAPHSEELVSGRGGPHSGREAISGALPTIWRAGVLKFVFRSELSFNSRTGQGALLRESFGLCSCGFAFVRVELSLNFPLSLFVVSR
jgi:hypothetical protein